MRTATKILKEWQCRDCNRIGLCEEAFYSVRLDESCYGGGYGASVEIKPVCTFCGGSCTTLIKRDLKPLATVEEAKKQEQDRVNKEWGY